MTTAAREPLPDTLPDTAPGNALPASAASVRVRRYLRFLGCPRQVIDDLAQDTMLASVRTFGDREPPLPWLLTTARNTLRMHWRRSGRRREVADLERLHDAFTEQMGRDGGCAQQDALRECLRALPERSRRVVELRYGEGLSRGAIAVRLGLGEEGVKSLLARVRAVLGDCIARRIET